MLRRNWKRYAALFLAGSMAVGNLAGCSEKDTQKSTEETAASAENGTEKETLTIALQSYSYITDYDDNYLTKLLEEKLDIDIQFHLLSADNSEAKTQLSLMMSSGEELPDIICADNALPRDAALEYGSKGVLIPIGDMLNDPAIAPNFNAIPDEDRQAMLEAATYADGNIYSLVQFEPSTWNLTSYRMLINEVWLEKLNLPVPTTTEEYYETLKAFKTQDPNGNGIADEIPAYGQTSGVYGENLPLALMNSFIYAPTTYSLTLNETGDTIIAPFTDDNWRKGLEYLNRLCTEGLLPESVFTDDKTQFMSVLNNEDANLVGSVSCGSVTRWNDYDNNANGQEYDMMAPLKGPEGLAYSPFKVYQPVGVWFVTSSCKNPELAVKLGDLFYDSDISTITRYGEKDVDWTTDPEQLSNPKYSNAYYESGILKEKSVLILNDIWGQNTSTYWRNISPRYASLKFNDGVVYAQQEFDPELKRFKFYADNYEYNYGAHPEHVLGALDYTKEEAQEQAEIIVNIETYVNQSMAQFITGARPLTDKEWETYKEELNTMGLPIWMENSQAAYDRKYK